MYKLLVADDEPIERETLKMMIAKYFPDIAVVGEAGNGREAIARAVELNPDIIFLDIKMPGILGTEAAKTLKQTNPALKIVMISAYDYFEYAQESLKAGIDDFLLKPALKEDIEAVLNRFRQQIEEERELQEREAVIAKRWRDMTAFIEKETIAAILLRLEERETAGYFDLLGFQPPGAYGVVAKGGNPAGGSPANSAKERVYNQTVYEQFTGELRRRGLQFISTTHQDLLYILILSQVGSNPYEQKTRALEMMDDVKSAVSLPYGYQLTIGVGLPYAALPQFAASFQEAQLALSFSEPSQSTHYSDLAIPLQPSSYPYQEEKQLCEELVRGNEKKSRESLDKIFNWLTAHCRSLDEMRGKIFELAVMMTRAAAIYEQIGAEFLDTRKYFTEIQNLATAQEVGGYLRRLVADFAQSIGQLRQVRLNSQIATAFQFIAAHYDKDITLEDVAKAVSLSPSYFSKIFKTETGENFIDYLTHYRMKAAERLLLNQDCSIKDVCYRVGYNDPNYFSKLFKKYYGMNPSEYKDGQ